MIEQIFYQLLLLTLFLIQLRFSKSKLEISRRRHDHTAINKIQKVEKRNFCLPRVELYRQFLIKSEKNNIILSF